MKTNLYTLLITIISITNTIIAQGIEFPDPPPDQAPIGGLELLIGAGGAMAWKKLKNRKK
jgi:hypothetical protein